MTIQAEQEDPEERLVKSAERVRDLGEVFTPAATVQEMLDLLPDEIWRPDPSPRFLEPACGDGNFLVAILARKLEAIGHAAGRNQLPAGSTEDGLQFHGLEALSSIYAVDLSTDNIVGGVPGHEIGARTRLLTLFADWNHQATGKRLTSRSLILQSAEWIVEHNVLVGNMLEFDADGKQTGRDELPLMEYTWTPETLSVSIDRTTLGATLSAASAESADVWSLSYASDTPEFLWGGKALHLGRADRTAAPELSGPMRNGTRRNGG
jgi:hypothetical protein